MQYARPVTTPSCPIVTVDRDGTVRCGARRMPLSAFELPALSWKQIGVSVVVGIGLGYVLFAKK